MKETTFSIREALGFGWAMTRERFFLMIAVLFVAGFFSWIPELVAGLTDNRYVLLFTKSASFVLGLIVDTGLVFVVLRLRDGKTAKLANLFSRYPVTFRYFVANTIYTVMTLGLPMTFLFFREGELQAGRIDSLFDTSSTLIMIVLCIPGIYLMLRYQFYKYFLVDKDVDIVDSFKRSAFITEGRKRLLFRFVLAIAIMNAVPLGALFFGLYSIIPWLKIPAYLLSTGLLVTIPVSMLAFAFAYRSLSTPPTEEPVPDREAVSGELTDLKEESGTTASETPLSSLM